MTIERQLDDYGRHLQRVIDDLEVPADLAPAVRPVSGGASARRPGRPIVAAAAAVVAAALVAAVPLLLMGRDDSGIVEDPTTTVVSTTLPPTTMPSATVPVLEVPLSEAVPGFTDTIVWSAWSENGRSLMRWRSSEPMAELLPPPEDNEDNWGLWGLGDALDASANWVAHVSLAHVLTVEAVPTVPSEPSRREIVAHDVRSVRPPRAVWHDTEPGHLAWLECPNAPDGPTTLVTLDVSDPSADPIRVRSFDQGCPGTDVGEDDAYDPKYPSVTLVRWGSTGVWVTKYPDDWEAQWFEDTGGQYVIESVLVDAHGAAVATVSDALMIAMSQDGTSVWQSDDRQGPYFVLSPDGRQRSTLPGLDDGETLRGAWWSPDGTRLAMWLREGILRTVDSVSGEVITEITRPRLDAYGGSLAWSTDSRFLVYEEWKGDLLGGEVAFLVIHDTATNTTTKVPLSGDVSDIRVR